MQKVFTCLLASTMMLTMISGCGGTSVRRTSQDEQIDLSGDWNDTDSQQTSKAMIQQCLNENPWVASFSAANNGKIPDVIVGRVKNRSSEHINVRTFVKDLERALINSGRVSFVADASERNQLRSERAEQQNNAAAETVKAQHQEAGADFMLIGEINTITDAVGGKSVKYYQINLELINMESNRKVWIGEKKIKKMVKKSKYKS